MIVEIWTDGSTVKNPGPGGWAAIFKIPNHCKALYGYNFHSTNNRMELTAAIEALNHLKKPCHVTLYSDSEYLIKGITGWIKKWKKNNWKTFEWDIINKHYNFDRPKDVENKDLWEALDKAQSRHEMFYVKVKGHDDVQENIQCDLIAKQAASLQIEGLREIVYNPGNTVTEKQTAQIPFEIARAITFE